MRVHLAAMAEYRVTPGHVAAWAKGKQAGGEAAYLLRAESPRSRPATRRSPTEALSQWEMGGIEHVALHRGDSRPQPHLQRMPAIGQWRRARPKQPPDRIGLCGPEGLPVHVDKACHISRRIRMPVASARSGYRRVARADRSSRHNKTGVADGCTGKESGHRHRASSGVSRLLST